MDPHLIPHTETNFKRDLIVKCETTKENVGSYFITRKWGAILTTKPGINAGKNVFINNDLHKNKNES